MLTADVLTGRVVEVYRHKVIAVSCYNFVLVALLLHQTGYFMTYQSPTPRT
jgi:hypothetical protein